MMVQFNSLTLRPRDLNESSKDLPIEQIGRSNFILDNLELYQMASEVIYIHGDGSFRFIKSRYLDINKIYV